MKLTTTLKIKLYVDTSSSKAFKETTEMYSSVCNEISNFTFENNQMKASFPDLRSQVYYSIRDRLKSQMACSVPRSVLSAYKTVETQLKNTPYVIKEKDKTYTFKRNLDWLQKPIEFKKPFVDLVRGRDWSFVKQDGEIKLSINTLNKREVVSFNHHFDDILFDKNIKLGTAKLVNKKGEWYLHISITKEYDEPEDINKIIGADRGLRFIITTYDGKNTNFINGCDVSKKRKQYYNTRKSLQSKNTRGSRRVLKRISGRENRFINDVNHCLSKALVSEPNSLIVLEDLTNISFETNKGKDFNRELSSWPFYDLELKIMYKAKANNVEVIKVPARYTSQRCPICGHIHKNNRQRDKHLFVCRNCGYTSNDDRIAAMNLYELGKRYLETGKRQGFSKR